MKRGRIRRYDGSRYGINGVVCHTCNWRLWARWKRGRRDEIPDTDGLLGETDAERREIEARAAEVFAESVLPRYLDSKPCRLHHLAS